MKPIAVILGLAGVGAAAGAAVLVARSKAPAEEKLEGVAAAIPTHTGAPQQNATKLQLLAAYESDLRKAQSRLELAEAKLREIEAAGNAPCNAYATSPRWEYRCNGFPICSINEWWELVGETRDGTAAEQCRAYVKGLGTIPASRTLEKKGDGGTRYAAMREAVAAGYRQATDLRAQHQQARAERDAARAEVAETQKKIADLNAQGVF
ncbi:hypothetical protein Mterra_01893 [Calidithermus terrae]|uniref:Uncharacterized protein n=1 Tax=Calidithermus terrae TaxID=1408545 RepID=A0A399EMI5_9DEIN|nr:hypothetical protein [Calidithermus terrae]RIH84713.1 hypothetical protein Mterra_01893 [Calidithermus terrae]